MIYPAIILSGVVFLSIGVSIFVLPKISQMFSSFNIKLPWTTRMLIGLSNFIENNGVLSLILFVLFIVTIIVLSKIKKIKPFIHKLLLKLPIIKNISKSYNLAMFYRSLSILMKSGVTIDEGLKICTKTINNHHYRRQVNLALIKIKAGQSLNEALKDKGKIFPLTDLQILTVGEESGTLADALAYSASIHEDDLDDITQNLTTILEPVLFIFLGVAVAILALSIITPIYSITEEFR